MIAVTVIKRVPVPLKIAQNGPFLTQSRLQALPAAEQVVTGGINAAENASSCVGFELPPRYRGPWDFGVTPPRLSPPTPIVSKQAR